MANSVNENKVLRSRCLLAVRALGLLCVCAVASLVVGCNPQALAMLLMPWVDNKEPSKCKIATPNKEVTVAIVTWFGNSALETNPDLLPCDNELSERLAAILRERYQANKDKVKIVPNAQVRGLQNKAFSTAWSPAKVGADVKADKVIALEINNLSLREKGTSSLQQLFRGNIDIAVKVYDLDRPSGEQVVFEDQYRYGFPRENPTDDFASVQQFRPAFLTRVARDLSRTFAAYPADERMYKMDTD